MNLQSIFFEAMPALHLIFKLDYVPTHGDFKELTPEQYESFREKASPEDLMEMAGEKIYALLPDNPEIQEKLVNEFGNNLCIFRESEISAFERAYNFIDKCCEGKHFDKLTAKLAYVAETIPPVFIKDTPYAR